MSVEFINELNESNSRTHKETVFSEALMAAKIGNIRAINFLKLAKIAYNPFVTFGVKQVPTTTDITGAENPWDDFSELLKMLQSRDLTGNAARDAIDTMSKRFDSDEWNLLARAVITKDLRTGVSEKTINKICKGTEYEVPVFGCQLATNNEGRPEMKGKKRLEGKLDGARMLLVAQGYPNGAGYHYTVSAMSRNGKEFENFDVILNQVLMYIDSIVKTNPELRAGFVLDGEVMGKSFQELMTQARRKTDAKADDCVYHVFDILPLADFNRGYWNAQQYKRIEILKKLEPIVTSMPNVVITEGIEVDLDTPEGRTEYEKYCMDSVNIGLEGVMIKDLGAPYICKRSTSWMKYKPVYTYDLTIVKVEEGEGKNSGKLGAFVCEGLDEASGKFIRVNVGSGFTDEERLLFFTDAYVGTVVEVMCDAITQSADGAYSLRFPRFVTMREDK